MLMKIPQKQILLIIVLAFFYAGCISPKVKESRAILPQLKNASVSELKDEVNHFAEINSMRGKLDVKFEDNSFAELGIAEKYRTVPGEIVLQRPAKILLKIQAPIIYSDIVQMTSDGERFRVAVLEDGGDGKLRRFVVGTNNADYSRLQETVKSTKSGSGTEKDLRKKVNAFAEVRPQHFTEAILMLPVASERIYVQSEFFQEEIDMSAKKSSPTRNIMRGYYFLDELRKTNGDSLSLSRRFWFDRVDKIRLARQQIFDESGNLESDIVYGADAAFTEKADHILPIRFEVTRPKERYKMSLSFSVPASVTIGRQYPETTFLLENRWNLTEVDLDKEMSEKSAQKPSMGNLF